MLSRANSNSWLPVYCILQCVKCRSKVWNKYLANTNYVLLSVDVCLSLNIRQPLSGDRNRSELYILIILNDRQGVVDATTVAADSERSVFRPICVKFAAELANFSPKFVRGNCERPSITSSWAWIILKPWVAIQWQTSNLEKFAGNGQQQQSPSS